MYNYIQKTLKLTKSEACGKSQKKVYLQVWEQNFVNFLSVLQGEIFSRLEFVLPQILWQRLHQTFEFLVSERSVPRFDVIFTFWIVLFEVVSPGVASFAKVALVDVVVIRVVVTTDTDRDWVILEGNVRYFKSVSYFVSTKYSYT